MKLIDHFLANFYKDGTKKIHWGKTLISIFALLLLVVYIFYAKNKNKIEKNELAQHKMYTIGITGKKYQNFRSSQPAVKFFYTVNKVEYSNFESIGASDESKVIPNGGRYYVEFSSQKPDNSRLLFNNPVSDSVINIPDSGWKYIPGYQNQD